MENGGLGVQRVGSSHIPSSRHQIGGLLSTHMKDLRLHNSNQKKKGRAGVIRQEAKIKGP